MSFPFLIQSLGLSGRYVVRPGQVNSCTPSSGLAQIFECEDEEGGGGGGIIKMMLQLCLAASKSGVAGSIVVVVSGQTKIIIWRL